MKQNNKTILSNSLMGSRSTSLSERYINNQFEKIKSSDSAGKFSSGDVTSAHINLTFSWCPLMLSFCKNKCLLVTKSTPYNKYKLIHGEVCIPFLPHFQ